MLGEEKNLKFKSPLWSAIYLLIIGNFLGLVFLVPFILKHRANLTISLLHFFTVLGIMVFAIDVLAGLILVECYKVKLKSNGISGYNIWGIYSFVLWDEIREIKIINFLGLKFARVYFRNSKTPLWVPLFIKNRKSFSATLSEFATASNLLRQAFEKTN